MHAPIPIGWREWVSLPELGIIRLKAKIDTGARTSALHAYSITRQKEKIFFIVRPLLRHCTKKIIKCTAMLIDEREVKDSGGHKELRYVIRTPIVIGQYQWPIEITLTSRDDMRFKMLLGRTALKGRFVVDPSCSYLLV